MVITKAHTQSRQQGCLGLFDLERFGGFSDGRKTNI